MIFVFLFYCHIDRVLPGMPFDYCNLVPRDFSLVWERGEKSPWERGYADWLLYTLR